MPSISASELDLLSFFGTEPKRLDPDVAWPYNEFLYELQVAHILLAFSIEPASRDVRMVLKAGPAILYELAATGLKDVRYHNDSGRETLEISVSDGDTLWLKVAPSIELNHSASPSEA